MTPRRPVPHHSGAKLLHLFSASIMLTSRASKATSSVFRSFGSLASGGKVALPDLPYDFNALEPGMKSFM